VSKGGRRPALNGSHCARCHLVARKKTTTKETKRKMEIDKSDTRHIQPIDSERPFEFSATTINYLTDNQTDCVPIELKLSTPRKGGYAVYLSVKKQK